MADPDGSSLRKGLTPRLRRPDENPSQSPLVSKHEMCRIKFVTVDLLSHRILLIEMAEANTDQRADSRNTSFRDEKSPSMAYRPKVMPRSSANPETSNIDNTAMDEDKSESDSEEKDYWEEERIMRPNKYFRKLERMEARVYAGSLARCLSSNDNLEHWVQPRSSDTAQQKKDILRSISMYLKKLQTTLEDLQAKGFCKEYFSILVLERYRSLWLYFHIVEHILWTSMSFM